MEWASGSTYTHTYVTYTDAIIASVEIILKDIKSNKEERTVPKMYE